MSDATLKNPKINFLLLLISRFTSDIGNAIFKFALSLYVLDVTGSAGIFSVMLSLTILPGVLVSIFAGAIVDKYDKKKIIILADVLSGIGVLLISLLLSFYSSNVTMFVFYVIGVSVVQAFLNLAINSSLPNIVDKERVPSVNSMFQAMGAVINIIGPIISSVLYAYIGIQMVTLINGITFLAGGLITCFIVFRPIRDLQPSDQGFSIISDVKFVLNYVRQRKILRFFILTLIVLNFVYMPITMLVMPHINYNVIDVSGIQLSIIQAALGVGVMIGALYVGVSPSTGHILRNFHWLVFALSTSVGVWAFAALPVLQDMSLWVAVIGFSVALMFVGTFNTASLIPVYSYLQLEVPENIRGRVFGVATTALNISVPIGIWFYGILLEQTEWYYSIAFSTLVLVFLGVYMMLSPTFRQFKSTLQSSSPTQAEATSIGDVSTNS